MKLLLLAAALATSVHPVHRSFDAATRLVLDLGEEMSGGSILVAVYETEDDFREETALYETSISVESQQEVVLNLPALPPAVYGIATFYDRNDNKKLDTNTFGIPREPYGFAGEPASKWRRPRWDEISTRLGDEERELRIDLKRWKDR